MFLRIQVSKKDGVRPCRYREVPKFIIINHQIEVQKYAACNCGWLSDDFAITDEVKRKLWERHKINLHHPNNQHSTEYQSQ